MSPEKMIGLSFAAPAAKLYEVFAELNARFQSEAGIQFIYSARFILRQ